MNIFIETVEVQKWNIYLTIILIIILMVFSNYLAMHLKRIRILYSQILIKPDTATPPQQNKKNYKIVHPSTSTQVIQESSNNGRANNPDSRTYARLSLLTHILPSPHTIKRIISLLRKGVNRNRGEPKE